MSFRSASLYLGPIVMLAARAKMSTVNGQDSAPYRIAWPCGVLNKGHCLDHIRRNLEFGKSAARAGRRSEPARLTTRQVEQLFQRESVLDDRTGSDWLDPRFLSNYRGPTLVNEDATLMKNFNVTEQKYVQLVLEAYGVTNSPQWGLPNTSFGDTSFGQITTSAGNRSLQIAVKFYY